MGRLPRQLEGGAGEGGGRRSSGAPSSLDSDAEGSGGVAEAGRKLVAAREGGVARNGPRPSDAGGQSVSSFTGSIRGEEEG